ncbi:MAG: hypothetical protein HUU35_02090 [Armatimonadetes bacterium]|nr:hypothetical protein [Armatimonadota bacterium]
MRGILVSLRQEPVLKLVSLLLAIFLWAWRSSESNPEEERRFTNLPVRVINLSEALTVVNEPPHVDLTLYGPRRTLDNLQATGELQPVVDLAGLDQPAWRSERIDVAVPDNVEIRTVEPDYWEAEIDRYETDVKPIRAEVGASTPPEGYLYEPPQVAAPTAQVTGPRRRVNRVAQVLAEVDLHEQVESFTAQARLRPVDSHGQPVPGVTCDPKEVTVAVAVARIEETRRMRVVVPIDRQPAPGYRVESAVAEPGTVTVNGTSAGLGRLGRALTTVPVAVAGRRDSFEQDVAVVLTPGVVASPAVVRVRVTIVPENRPG